MSVIDFPNSPSVNDTFTAAGTTWVWDGVSWNVVRTPIVGPTGPTGPTGPIFQNIDGGEPDTIYGGTPTIDCGGV
jgi:hypothetical protein